MDRIRLQNMKFYVYQGVFDAEKELGHDLEVDVELALDLAVAGQNDDLALTLNYAEVYAQVRQLVQAKAYDLLEAIAETVAAAMLRTYSLKETVVRVRKPHPPVGGLMDFAEVEIVRQPGELATD